MMDDETITARAAPAGLLSEHRADGRTAHGGEVRKRLRERLQAEFAGVIDAPLPERLRELVARLRDAARA